MSDMVFSQRMPVTRFVPLKMLTVAPPLLIESLTRCIGALSFASKVTRLHT